MTYLVHLLLSFTGRISRKSWWLGFVVVSIGNLLGAVLFNPEYFTADELPPPNWADTIWQIAWLVPATAITVKRFNDRDWPGWLGYLFAPIATLFYLAPHFPPGADSQTTLRIVVACLSAAYLLFALVDNGFFLGTEGSNRYGPDPLATREPPR
jgi:uncharacterized membrane protein YhaH (DUF805 family)